jgi:aldehyde dehydrogenase (NAD+)
MELGGKNPCVITADADLRLAARRIVWGKFFNAGQSCAAPDYLLVQKDVKPELMNLICKEVRRMYGENPLDSGKFTSMPDAETYQRILDLISDGRLICGGNHNPKMLSVEPTVIDRLPDDSPLFTGEVFGPVLPVREFSTEDELMVNLNRLPRPLAAYCFGGSKKLRDFFRCRYSAGAVIFNDVMLHFCNMNIPFGGVGKSGFGAYHGAKSFITFTHEKPVMVQSSWLDIPARYPKFSKFFQKLLEKLYRM